MVGYQQKHARCGVSGWVEVGRVEVKYYQICSPVSYVWIGKICEDPGTPTGGRRINGNFSLGEVVYFVCMDDYDLVGSNARRCQDNCTWSGRQPLCVLRNSELRYHATLLADH